MELFVIGSSQTKSVTFSTWALSFLEMCKKPYVEANTYSGTYLYPTSDPVLWEHESRRHSADPHSVIYQQSNGPKINSANARFPLPMPIFGSVSIRRLKLCPRKNARCSQNKFFTVLRESSISPITGKIACITGFRGRCTRPTRRCLRCLPMS